MKTSWGWCGFLSKNCNLFTTTITESVWRSQAYQPLVVVSFHLYIVLFFAVYLYSSFVSFSVRKVTFRVISNLIDRSFSRNIFELNGKCFLIVLSMTWCFEMYINYISVNCKRWVVWRSFSVSNRQLLCVYVVGPWSQRAPVLHLPQSKETNTHSHQLTLMTFKSWYSSSLRD